MTLLSRKRLMGISLIALVALSACTDDVDGDRGTGLTGHRLSFIVSMDGEEAQTRADGSETTAATRYLNSVELKGRQGGKSVYLQAEETDGFPGDGQPLTRGTQINSAANMNAFAVSIYSDPTGTPDQMYNKKVENVSSTWTPEKDYHWSKGQKLSFFAWYPYEKVWDVTTDENTAGAPVLAYTVPSKVEEQQDLMTAVRLNQSETVGGTKLQFKHALSAVRFMSGSSLSKCTLHYIKLKGVKNKGAYSMETQGWTLDNDTTSYTFTLEKEMDGTPGAPITEGDQTLLLMPQVFEDENAELEVYMSVGIYSYTLTAKLKDVTGEWKPGKTYTYKISDALSDILKVDVNFFKGTNYTVHNISANGDPYTIDITYPYPNHVKKVEARLRYSNAHTVETFDLTGKTSVSRTSLCMNNNGDPSKAMAYRQGFMIEIRIESDVEVKIIAPRRDANASREYTYSPAENNDTWYCVWYGDMYPPNYIDATYKVIISRENATNTLMTMEGAVSLRPNYYEVDVNHPKYGKGQWGFPNVMGDEWTIHRGDILYDMVRDCAPPGNNSLYGSKILSNNLGAAVWTNQACGYAYNGAYCYWAIKAGSIRSYDKSYFDSLPHQSNSGNAQLTPNATSRRGSTRFVIMY